MEQVRERHWLLWAQSPPTLWFEKAKLSWSLLLPAVFAGIRLGEVPFSTMMIQYVLWWVRYVFGQTMYGRWLRVLIWVVLSLFLGTHTPDGVRGLLFSVDNYVPGTSFRFVGLLDTALSTVMDSHRLITTKTWWSCDHFNSVYSELLMFTVNVCKHYCPSS